MLNDVLRRLDETDKHGCKLISPECVCKYKFRDAGMQQKQIFWLQGSRRTLTSSISRIYSIAGDLQSVLVDMMKRISLKLETISLWCKFV